MNKKPSQRKPFTEPLIPEEYLQIEQRARSIWKVRKDDGKITAEDDWFEAIAQLKGEHILAERERAFPGKRVREVGGWAWQQTGLKDKTLWDLFQALMVPITLVVIGFGLQEFAKQRDSAQQEVARQQEQALADNKARQETLVRYLAEMSDLLEKGLLKSPQGSETVIIAQLKTVTTLQSLDPKRQQQVLQFLAAADLNSLNKKGLLHGARIAQSDFRGSDLSYMVMNQAILAGAKFGCLFPDKANRDERHCSNLHGASLTTASLSSADFSGADFSGANLEYTDLSQSNLTGAILTQAQFSNATFNTTNLTNATLNQANLNDADLTDAVFDHAVLIGTTLTNANLNGAIFTNAILLGVDLSTSQALTEAQLTGTNPPFLCGTQLPDKLENLSNRDCDRLPVELVKRDPEQYPTLDQAKESVELYRQRTP